MRNSLFRDFTEFILVVRYRRFGTTYRSHLKRSRALFRFSLFLYLAQYFPSFLVFLVPLHLAFLYLEVASYFGAVLLDGTPRQRTSFLLSFLLSFLPSYLPSFLPSFFPSFHFLHPLQSLLASITFSQNQPPPTPFPT